MNMNQIGSAGSESVGAIPGGALIRFVAVIVDSCILAVVTIIPSFILQIAAASLEEGSGLAIVLMGLAQAMSIAIGVLYYGWFYQNRGATPGKMIFRLRVVDVANGSNIGYGKTILRHYVGAFVCVLTLGIGYLMIPFRQDKRGLHDFIAGTQVIQMPK